MDRREAQHAAWVQGKGPRTEKPEVRLKLIAEKGFKVGDVVVWNKYALVGGFQDGGMIDGGEKISGCKIIGFTPTHFVQIEVPYGVLDGDKDKTRVSPRNLTK
jgi:hypothetical protein